MITVHAVDSVSNDSQFGSFGPFPSGKLAHPPRFLVLNLGGTATALPTLRLAFTVGRVASRAEVEGGEKIQDGALTLAVDFSANGAETVLVPIDGNMVAGRYLSYEFTSSNAMDSFTGFIGVR